MSERAPRQTRRPVCTLIAVLFTASVVTGCSQMPFHDESYRTRIPEALERADLDISNPWAGISLSGFVETLNVGGNVDLTTQPDQQISPDFLREVLDVVLSNDPPPSRYIDMSFRDSDDERIDLDEALQALTGSARGDGSMSVDEAKRIVSEDTD